MKKFLAIFFIILSYTHLVYSDSYQLIPENLLSSSDCATSNLSCPSYIFNPDQECKSGQLDSKFCTEYQNSQMSNITMVELGNIMTEGAYVKCNGGTADLDNCTKNGAFSIVSDYQSSTPNPKRIAHDKFSRVEINTSNGFPYYCPIIRCDVRTEDVAINVRGWVNTDGRLLIKKDQEFPFEYKKAESTTSFFNNIKTTISSPSQGFVFRGVQFGNNLCVTLATTLGQYVLGCKSYPSTYTPPPPSPKPDDSCFKTTSCTSASSSHSRVFWSFSSKVVECVRDVLSIVFINDDKCQNKNFLPALQKNLRTTVMIAIVLYIILFGVKLVTSNQLISKNEFFMLILKIALVLYFSVGIKGNNDQYESGLTTLIYPGGMAAMTSFSTFVMGAASSGGLCNYNANDYDPGYEYLALWDNLDCHVAYYLGLYMIKDSGVSSNAFASGIYGILGTIIPMLLSLELVLVILVIIYGLFVLAVAIYFVHFYVIAMVAFSIAVYVGVIVVPFALFSYTKQFFDAWVKLLLSYVLQPVIVTVFLAFLLLVFDSVIYGNCNFKKGNVFGSYDTWTIDGSACTDPKNPRCTNLTQCKDTFGWLFLGALDKDFVDTKSAIFFDYAVVGAEFKAIPDLAGTALKIVLFIYLLALFAEDLGSFASRLTSGPNIGQLAKDPAAMFKDIMKAITSKGAGKAGSKDKGKSSDKGVSASGAKRSGIGVSKGK